MLKIVKQGILPRGAKTRVRKLASLTNVQKRFNLLEVVQLDSQRIKWAGAEAVKIWEEVWEKIKPNLPTFSNGFQGCEAAILYFRQVSEHKDDWPPVHLKGRRLAPCFLHLVLDGSATIHVDRQKLLVQPGDMFVIDMNKRHKVTDTSLCTTACLTYPRFFFSGSDAPAS